MSLHVQSYAYQTNGFCFKITLKSYIYSNDSYKILFGKLALLCSTKRGGGEKSERRRIVHCTYMKAMIYTLFLIGGESFIVFLFLGFCTCLLVLV